AADRRLEQVPERARQNAEVDQARDHVEERMALLRGLRLAGGRSGRPGLLRRAQRRPRRVQDDERDDQEPGELVSSFTSDGAPRCPHDPLTHAVKTLSCRARARRWWWPERRRRDRSAC